MPLRTTSPLTPSGEELVRRRATCCAESRSCDSSFCANMDYPSKHAEPMSCDSSFCSNMDCPSKQRCDETPMSRKSSRLRFSLQLKDVHVNHVICQEDIMDLWYTKKDYASFRESYVETTKEIMYDEKRRRRRSASSAEQERPLSYVQTMESVHAACCDYDSTPTILTEPEMIQLCSVMGQPDRLGMERVSSRNIRMDKRTRVSELIDTILEVQEASDDETEADYVQETLASLTQSISLPSRLFAIFIAQALHLSLSNE